MLVVAIAVLKLNERRWAGLLWVISDVLSTRLARPLCPQFQTYRCLAANRNKQLRLCAPSEGWFTLTHKDNEAAN